MTGFNLPPGCTTSMIPGNRPGDLALEVLYDKIYNMLEKHGKMAKTGRLTMTADGLDRAVEELANFVDEVEREGYNQAVKEGLLDKEMVQQSIARGDLTVEQAVKAMLGDTD